MSRFSTKKLVLSGLFIALGMLLPFLTGQIPTLGNMLLPMHIPVLLCGFICGWPYGLIVGFIVPVLRSATFGMPPMFPSAVAMSFELAAYGFLSGLLYKVLPKSVINTYVSLIISMAGGRIVWGVVMMAISVINANTFTLTIFFTQVVINAIPGIVLQIVLIPPIIMALEKMNRTQDILN
jgi:hypothetical protein